MHKQTRFSPAATALFLALTLFAVVAPLAPVAAHAAADPSVAHVDGYISVSPDGRCMALRQHDGSLLTLDGRRRGLLNNDHVRMEGRMVADNRCGGQGGFDISLVQTIWADDRHKSTYYDQLRDGTFDNWLARNRPNLLH
jgi:hypothetical protein